VAESNRPAISIAIKKVGAKDRIYALAGWEREGKVTGMQLDKRIKAVKFLMEDGEVVEMTRGADGKLSHYIDYFDNRQERKAKPAPKDEPSLPVDDEGW
jgi:hypothetical protein